VASLYFCTGFLTCRLVLVTMVAPNYCGGTRNSQQSHKYFLQYTTFTSEISQVQTWGHQTFFLPQVPSNLVMLLLVLGWQG